MRFALFKGHGQYGAIRMHVDQLAAALNSLGHEGRVFDLAADDAKAQLDAALADPAECYFGISGIGGDIKVGERSAFDALNATYAAIYVDHPLHHLPRLQTPIARKIAFFVDRTHVQFMSAWGPGRDFAHVGFLPAGANELDRPVDLSDEAFAARDVAVLFTGTYRGSPARPWLQWPEGAARTISTAVADRMAADAQLPVVEALRGVMKALGVELTPKLFGDLAPLLQAVQAFSEAYHRDRLLHVLGRAAAPLRIYGAGWEALLSLYPSFDWGGVGSFEETLHLLRRAKVVLNTNNGFVAGGHERVFTAMCGGAGVFSDPSSYYAEAFKDGREITTFSWRRIEEAPARLEMLLADPRLPALARAGATKALGAHRWTHRAETLVKAVQQVR